MSIPKKHHYVPQCYLKNFQSDADSPLFTLNVENIKKGFKVKPNKMYPSGICYKENYYQIKEPLILSGDLNNSDFIEKIVNHYYEDKFQSVFNRVINFQSISREDAIFFADFIVHLKIRNPYQVRLNEKRKIEKIISLAKEKHLEKQEAIQKGVSPLIFDAVYQNLIIELMKRESLTKDFQLESITQKFNDPEKNLKQFRTAIMASQWTLLESENDQEPFITTDNPGIAVDSFGMIHNTKFVDGFNFFFPLSPKYVLEISDSKTDPLPTNKKELNRKIVNSKLVNRLNLLFTKVSEKYLISNKSEVLRNFIKL